MKSKPPLLMTPGPVPLPDVVKAVFGSFEMHHRTGEFSQILLKSFECLKRVFQTKEHCYVLPATGTGGMEAAIVNTLCPGDKVLIVNGGKFGQRWSQLSKTFGLNPEIIEVPWGEAVDPSLIRKKLDKETKAILIQGCETSTGVAHPLKDVGEILKDHSALFIVDGITAVAGYDVPMDKWGIDILIAGSQKGFMLPTGLSFISFSQKAQAQMPKSTLTKSYFDLSKERKANEDGKTRYSSPVQFIKSLVEVCEKIILTPSLFEYFDTIEKRAQIFRDAVDLPLFSKTPSPTLTCLEVPSNFTGSVIKKSLFEDFGISIVGGQDAFKDRLLRVGHMGQMNHSDLIRTAEAINSIIKKT